MTREMQPQKLPINTQEHGSGCGCIFCNKLAGCTKNFAQMFPEYRGVPYIIAQSRHFAVIPELHPVVNFPYYLIVPTDYHYSAFSRINQSYHSELDELGRGIVNQSGYPDFVMFEHGEQRDDMKKVQSVYHAHTHLIPTNQAYIYSIEEQLRNAGIRPTIVNFRDLSTIDCLRKLVEDRNYLLFRQGEWGLVVFEYGDKPIPSQTFRVMMHEADYPSAPFPNWKKPKAGEKERFQAIIAENIFNVNL